jgi:hydroxyacylglutathione hydrolase
MQEEIPMALVFERVLTDGLGDLSYLIGDDSKGEAAVIDPRADVEVYLELARQHQVAITYVLQTHNHEDFLSGARELAARTGSASVYLSHEGGRTEYGFEHRPLRSGDTFDLGSVILTARHTPGHTPEHVALLAAESKRPDSPYGVFSGGSLLIDAAGRTDLLGEDEAEKLSSAQYHTLYDFYLGLDDHVLLHPTHAHGSPCGAAIGDRLSSSIGYERRFNPFLQFQDERAFREFALGGLPPKPTYYPRLKRTNAEGPEVLGGLPRAAALPAPVFREAAEARGSVVVDTRSMLAFGGGHVPGALNIGARPELSVWAGWMLDAGVPLLLVLEDDTDLEKVVRLFLRTGFTKLAGYLAGGMKAWGNAGFPLERVRQLPVHELHEHRGDYQILDVRKPDELEKGRIPGARHIFLPELREKLGTLSRSAPIATYCDSGYRASVAASLLQQEGFTDVSNVPGSWQAWKKAGLPVES